MSFLLSAALSSIIAPNNSLSFTGLIQRDSPNQETLIIQNTGQSPITGFSHDFAALTQLALLATGSSCNSISLVHPLAPDARCTYTLRSLDNLNPHTQSVAFNLVAVGDNTQTYSGKFLVTTATYLYAASLANVQAWDGQSWHIVGANTSPNKVNALGLDAQNNVYAGGQNDIEVWNGQSWNKVGVNPPLGTNTLAFDALGNLYAGTATGGVRVLFNSQNSWTALGTNGPIDVVKMIYINDQHTLYAGTNDYTQAWDGTSWHLTPGAPLLGSVSFAYNPQTHMLYTGTDAGMVYQLDLNLNQGWSLLGMPGEKYDLVDALTLTPQGLLLAGMDNGDNSIKAYQNKAWSPYGSATPSFVTALVVSTQGQIYAANYGDSTDVFALNSAQGRWVPIANAPGNTIVNDLALGSELDIVPLGN